MYAVGVGKAVEDELREISSEPVEKHFYYTTDFTAISTIAENLKLNVCPGTNTLDPTLNKVQDFVCRSQLLYATQFILSLMFDQQTLVFLSV